MTIATIEHRKEAVLVWRLAYQDAEEQQRLWARYPTQQARFDTMQQPILRTIPVVALQSQRWRANGLAVPCTV